MHLSKTDAPMGVRHHATPYAIPGRSVIQFDRTTSSGLCANLKAHQALPTLTEHRPQAEKLL